MFKLDKVTRLEIAIFDIIDCLLRDGRKFLSMKDLASHIQNELLSQGIEVSHWKVKTLLKEKFNLEMSVLVRRRIDLRKIILEYKRKGLHFDSIKDLASHIANQYGLNPQSVYSRLLFLADRDNEIGEYLRAIKFKRRESWVEALLFLITMMTEGKKAIPLLPGLLKLKEESIEVLASLIFNIQTMRYRIQRRKGRWILIKED